MEFGVMFFSALDTSAAGSKYRLLFEAATFADRRGFSAVWLPERHFHEFGGLFPNPAVLAAAVATTTSRIQLRAGSIIPPLHDPLRIAEEWAVVDNLSNGRVAMSYGSGWNANDFVFFPDRFHERRSIMRTQIDTILDLWAGNGIARTAPSGETVEIRVFPRPVQARPDVWITAGGSRETFIEAGGMGAHLLTSLEKLTIDDLTLRIAEYREARRANGFDPATGKVAVMLHTFLGDDAERVEALARPAMRRYLESAIALDMKAQRVQEAGCGLAVGFADMTPADRDFLTARTFDRYFRGASLMGTVDERLRFVEQLSDVGVDEIACLIDFLDEPSLILEGLPHLDRLRRACSLQGVSGP